MEGHLRLVKPTQLISSELFCPTGKVGGGNSLVLLCVFL